MKIMLADDEMNIVKIVEHIVMGLGHEFTYARNGKEAVDMFFAIEPDLVILDIMMPFLDGFDVCGLIRQKSNVPIIFLSAKGDIVDKTMGFKLGADDYLVKPFLPVELEMRINVQIKRVKELQGVKDGIAKKEIAGKFTYKDLVIDLDHFEAYMKDEKLMLTFKEFSILALLAKNQGQTFTRSQIIDAVWGDDFVGDFNTLTVFIRKLREKIEPDPGQPEYILTVWGIGYKMQ